MSTKHVFNHPDGLVLKALRGAVWLNPGLRLHAQSKSVYTCKKTNARVAVISGGGAGHEPAHAGYTGRGMLAAAVSGDIFASPSATQILTCMKLAMAAQDTSDILLVVNNYTGDRLNFGLAAVRAEALRAGVQVKTVVVADDVALCDKPSLVGARGLAGNILICKLLGSAAESELDLGCLKCLGDTLTSNLASIGVGLAHCHVPGRPKETKEDVTMTIADGECELGLGLHNEPGVRRMDVGDVTHLVSAMLDQILTSETRRARARGEEGTDRIFVDSADEVILYVNNLGGMSVLEMSAIVDEVVSQLASMNVHAARVLSSSYMTSLNAPGFSVSLLNLSSACRKVSQNDLSAPYLSISQVLRFLDAPTEATSWFGVTRHWPDVEARRDITQEEERTAELLNYIQPSVGDERGGADESLSWRSLDIDPSMVKAGILAACKHVLAVESDLTDFDTQVGDGDCGETFSSGAKAVLYAIGKDNLRVEELEPAQLSSRLADLLLESMGGTSGAIFGLYFSALSNALLPGDASNIDVLLVSAPLSALQALSMYTPARPGDRTLVDALSPFCHSIASGEGFYEASRKARAGANGTRGMPAKLGRATYVQTFDADAAKLPPDPGAWGVAAILEGFVEGYWS